ncbi:MAG: pyridoxal-phosphate dependent enzyme [Acidimicrobiales bacterium]
MTARVGALPAELALICSGCGARSVDPLRFSCPERVPGDDIDHVLVPPEPVEVPWPAPRQPDSPDSLTGADPFLRYRRLLYAYRLHRAWGGTDAGFVTLVERLQAEVAGIDPNHQPFRITPLRRFNGGDLVPGAAPPVVWVKDETRNVSGSHKGRHFMGLALYLTVVDQHLGADRTGSLAISSCGNAALAAAVLARALDRAIEVFVPADAAPSVLRGLERLGATVQPCARIPGQRGDPCQAAFEAAVARGAVPFSAQGPSNGLALDGAATLGYELADQLRGRQALDHAGVARFYVQVGGGALASSVMTGLGRAHVRGVLGSLPALHTVQAAGAAPFSRAVTAITAITASTAITGSAPMALREVLARLARHRSEAMQPWPGVPSSVAGGILDDETYDWRSVAEALVISGGQPVLVSEEQLVEANDRAMRITGIDVDCTGSAGLAGVWADAAKAATATAAPVLVLFTGARR